MYVAYKSFGLHRSRSAANFLSSVTLIIPSFLSSVTPLKTAVVPKGRLTMI